MPMESPSTADVARWPWPTIVRVLVGASAGFVVVEWLVRPDGPDWRLWVAMATLAVAGWAAPSTDAWAGRGITSGIALVTSVGIFLGPPETDHVLGMALGLAVLWLAEVTGRARVDGLVVLAIDVLLVWAAVWGASGRAGAVVGGVAMLGLLLVAPLVRWAPGPARGLPPEWQGYALVGLQLVFVVVVARLGALRESALEAAVVSGVSLVVLVLLARIVVGRSS